MDHVSKIFSDTSQRYLHFGVVVHLFRELLVPIEKLAWAKLLAQDCVNELLHLQLVDRVLHFIGPLGTDLSIHTATLPQVIGGRYSGVLLL